MATSRCSPAPFTHNTQYLKTPGPRNGSPLRSAAARAKKQAVSEEVFQLPPLNQDTAVAALVPLVDGKVFTCTECGKCCTGKGGEVWANSAECTSLARHLGLSEKHFMRKYIKSYNKRPGWYMLQTTSPTGDCVFLKDKKCSVYGARPLQCQTYPWWPELMGDDAWADEAELCEGINHETASVVDGLQAAKQLQASAVYTAAFDEAGAARSAARKRR